MKFAANIDIMPKQEISDPQGQAVERTLPSLGFDSVQEVRVGKRIEIVLEAADQGAAEAMAVAMCDKMLANPVIEDYELEVIEVEETPAGDPSKAPEEPVNPPAEDPSKVSGSPAGNSEGSS